MFDSIEEALEDLAQGKLIIVADDENRENEGDFIGLAEKADPEMINFMAKEGRGLICAPITGEKAERLGLSMMAGRNTDVYGTAFTVSIDHISATTGISAHERARTIREMTEGSARSGDFRQPGHIFPLVARSGGVLERAGHTEAAVDLARLAGEEPAAVICEIMNEDGTMARVPELREIADRFGLKMVTIAALIDYRKRTETLVTREVEIRLPTDYGHFRAIGYVDSLTNKEHIAIVKGDPAGSDPVLLRVHSECLTGDIFGSFRCDCGPQLESALSQIEEEGSGVLLYMRQEGRGIGLMNKLKAYKLQEEGLDTVEANHRLGFPADLRDYRASAGIIKDLGIRSVRLMTNNPRKISGLESQGIHVAERVPIKMEPKEENKSYLKTKAEKLGHLMQV